MTPILPSRTVSPAVVPRPTSPSELPRALRIVGLDVVLAVVAFTLVRSIAEYEPVSGFHIPWLILAGSFYLAEIAVIHIEYRRDAHSFSMSEVPLVIGFFFAAPEDVILAQLVANIVALGITRRQAPPKLAFNLGQFVIQTSLALIVFHAIAEGVFGARSVFAAVAAALTALVSAHLMVTTAIFLTGGRETLSESLEVLVVQSIGTVMYALLALGGVVIIEAAPDAAALAAAPPIFLFLAFRAYSAQRQERQRVAGLFEAARSLHRSPQLEQALSTAGTEAVKLVKAESAWVLLFGDSGGTHYLTSVGPGEHRRTMYPVSIDVTRPPWQAAVIDRSPRLIRGDEAEALRPGEVGPSEVHEAIVTPLSVDGNVVGLLVAANRLGNAARFTGDDVQVLGTLASQVSVSLENGRLSETLGEVRKLKTELERLVESKDELIASVSHELRTPLTGVVGLAQMLRNDLPAIAPDEVGELAAMIADQSLELSHLVDDLLVQARAEIGTLTINPTVLDLDSTLREALRAHQVGHAIDLDLPRTGLTVFADPLRFKQIFRNLLTNAERYGGRSVWVDIRASGGDVCISVCDDGDGVPADQADAIFEPYRSAHQRPTMPNSVGLGLSVARRIARMMDGDLSYRRFDNGTAFDLRLPCPLSVSLEVTSA